jgi:O-antigen/teichoic acid export membrane protein
VIRSTFNRGLQFGGILASYATPILISRFGGAEDQGHYASLKSLFDLANALFLIGLPQSLVLMINRQHTNIKSIAPFIQVYSIIVFFVFLSLSLFAKSLFPNHQPITGTMTAYLAVALGISGFVTFGLVRAVFLTRNDGTWFSLFTTLPQLLLLCGAVLVVANGSNNFAISFALLGAIMLPLAHALLRSMALNGAAAHQNQHKLPPLGMMLSENLHAFVQAIFYNLQPWLTFVLIAYFGGTKQDIGLASIVILPIQALHAVIGLFSPVIFNRLSKSATPKNSPLWTMDFLKWPIALQAGALFLIPFAEPLVTGVFGSSFAHAAPALQAITLSTFPAVLSRTLSPHYQTAERAMNNSASCAIRLLVALVTCDLMISLKFDILICVAVGWTVAEWLSATALVGGRFWNRKS